MEGLNQGEALPYIKKTKKRPSVTKRAKIIGVGSAAVAAVLAFGGLYLQQQETIDSNAAQAGSYDAAPIRFAEKRPRAVFIGDSYTQGTGASEESDRWTKVLSRDMGWNERNVAVGSAGYINGVDKNGTFFDEMLKTSAGQGAYVVIFGGRNDVWYEEGEMRAATNSFIQEAKARYVGATLIVVNPIWDSSEAPEGLATLQEISREAATDNGAIFLDIGQPLANKDVTYFAQDGYHPSDKGHALIAEEMRGALRDAGVLGRS